MRLPGLGLLKKTLGLADPISGAGAKKTAELKKTDSIQYLTGDVKAKGLGTVPDSYVRQRVTVLEEFNDFLGHKYELPENHWDPLEPPQIQHAESTGNHEDEIDTQAGRH